MTIEVTYDNYLLIEGLLAGVQPKTPERCTSVYAAEHFFIVTHQASELWLKQLLIDLDNALVAMSAPDRDVERASEHVCRAAGVMRLLVEHVGILKRLQPWDFAEFRGELGSASGAQSAQFGRLRRLLGQHGSSSPLCEELLLAMEDSGLSLEELYRGAPLNGPHYRLAEAMIELSHAFWHWQVAHIEIVSRTIGRSRGTGGSSGAHHLANRLEMPFAELWEARAGLQSLAKAGH